MSSANVIRLLLAGITLAALAAATVLEGLGHPSTNEWKLTLAGFAALIGQHLDKPSP